MATGTPKRPSRMLKSIDDVLSKYPTYATVLFWILTSIITLNLIGRTLAWLFAVRFALWQFIVALAVLSSLLVVAHKRVGLTHLKVLANPRVSLILLVAAGVATGLAKLAKPTGLTFDIVRVDLPEIDSSLMTNIDASLMFAMALSDLKTAYTVWDVLFDDKAGEIIDGLVTEYETSVRELVARILSSPRIAIDILVDNRTGKKLTVHRVDGHIRVGKETLVFSPAGAMRMRGGVVELSEEYLDEADYYDLDSASMFPEKPVLEPGDAGEGIRIRWHLSDPLRSSVTLQHAMAFQLRKGDIVAAANETYENILLQIYEQWVNERFDLPARHAFGLPDMSVIGIEVELTVYHTYGHTTVRKNLAIGVLSRFEVQEAFWSFGVVKYGWGKLDGITVTEGSEVILDIQPKNRDD